ncbi:MAG: type II toxin-antitoxin system VapC family toxin [Magnetococcales bacterium]|nr:type II toxin-antitoxin system VapC family toxin [Magnetococcales bacterium]
MTLVDTNVLLDLVTADPLWADWSIRQLDMASLRGPLIINDVVYAELSVRFDRIESLDQRLEEARITLEAMPRAALFLAGKAFRRYRATGGVRNGVLPDFFIGAHAAVLGLPLLTRDLRRYQACFPSVRLIAPGM